MSPRTSGKPPGRIRSSRAATSTPCASCTEPGRASPTSPLVAIAAVASGLPQRRHRLHRVPPAPPAPLAGVVAVGCLASGTPPLSAAPTSIPRRSSRPDRAGSQSPLMPRCSTSCASCPPPRLLTTWATWTTTTPNCATWSMSYRTGATTPHSWWLPWRTVTPVMARATSQASRLPTGLMSPSPGPVPHPRTGSPIRRATSMRTSVTASST